jgi:hypothetical protein
MLKGFGAVAPLVTDVNLSLDDKYLYVSCWGSGEFRQYDVSDPFHPKLNSKIAMGGIVRRAAHPSNPGVPLNGGPQMVELSRDGRRVYVTNSLYAAVDKQFYPDGINGWMMKIDVDPATGEMRVDPRFFPHFGRMRPHQTRLRARRFLRLVLLRRSCNRRNDIPRDIGGIGPSRPQSRHGRARHAGRQTERCLGADSADLALLAIAAPSESP